VDTRLGVFGFCLLWGDVADGGVDAPPIVIAFDIGEQVAPRRIQQFPLRLIDWVMAAACRMSLAGGVLGGFN